MRFIRSNAIALVALVFAMTGTGLAASHYVITSTKQIKPSVLRKLRGAKGAKGAKGARGARGWRGPRGARGVTGPSGQQGLQGKEGIQGKEGPRGQPGPFASTLPPGQTLTGVYNVEGFNTTTAADFAGGSISFHFALASAPQNRFLHEGEHSPECPGSVGEPKAQPGWLCVYEFTSKGEEHIELGESSEPYARYGDFISLESTPKVGGFFSTGSWAVTGD